MVMSVALAAPAMACINGDEFHPSHVRSLGAPVATAALPPPLTSEDLKALRPRNEIRLSSARPTIALEAPPVAPVFGEYIKGFEAKKTVEPNATFEKRLDYSVALIRVGRVADAIVELRAIEAAFPRRYQTAANLGTAYELDGKLELALEWIARGIERNPDSHGGTEWLHVAILQAKLKMKADPAWLSGHNVLEGFEDRSSAEIVRAIEYQLNERLVFVQPEDAVVCDLFYQAATRLEAGDPKLAGRREAYLRESLRFGGWRKAEVQRALGG